MTLVPMYPFSQDKTKYDRLINVLALYRLTLGQPRQEEMISILQREDLSSEQMEELFFDLSPYSRKQRISRKETETNRSLFLQNKKIIYKQKYI